MDQHGLTFPVLYGVDGPATARAWGAYYEERRNILHATGFLLSPERKVLTACYSTAAVGRIEPHDALQAIAFYQKQAAGG